MTEAYLIRASLGRAKKDFRCASAWIAYEQYNRLLRQGWRLRVFNDAREQLTAEQLHAAAQTEIGTAVNDEKFS